VLLRAILVTTALLAACGDDGGDPGVCITGDPALDVDVQVVGRELAPLADGGTIPLEMPPQGGYVVFAGLRVHNANLCGASVQAALRDPCSGRVVGIERRPVAWRIADDGFAEPAQPLEISDFANVPACPNAGISHDVDGHPLQLELRLYEASGRETERTLTVTPTCPSDDDYCLCACDSEFGGACPPIDPDGGVDCPADAAPPIDA